jgi:CheY-like chemotaxis protein
MLRKILLTDDNRVLRTAVARRLSEFQDSFEVVTAEDGFDAVGKLKEHPISVAVLDLVMPRMDGISLISHLKQHYPDIPIIIVSGLGNDKVKDVARNSGAYGYLNKPFLADDLITMIQQLLAREAEGGIMNDVSPPVFMQLMEMDAKTCTIRMLDNQSGMGGILHFSQGQLLDARVGEVSGIKAAYELFSWDRTTIFINNECRISEDRIGSALGPIIMQAAGMKDESEERPDDYSEGELIAALSDDQDLEAGSPAANGARRSVDGEAALSSIGALRQRLGSIAGVERVGAEPDLDRSVAALRSLGEKERLGQLVLAHLNENLESARIVVPTEPAAVVKVKPNSASAEIRKVLQG